MLQLRPYQKEAIDAALNSGYLNQLIVLPTGTGKTHMFLNLAKIRDSKTLIIVHRDELIRQTVDKISSIWPEEQIGIIKAKLHEVDHKITVASVQSLNARRLQRMNGITYDTIITDEAHHAVAKSYMKVYEWGGVLNNPHQTAMHIGVAVTPICIAV